MLRVLRSYLDLDMWEYLEVHTPETIRMGREAISQFSTILVVCI